MRKNSKFGALKAAAVALPLLVACDTASTGGGEIVTIPTTCSTGEALSTEEGKIVCRALPAGVLTLPTCNDIEALTADGKTLSCTNRNEDGQGGGNISETLSQLNKTVMDYGTRVTTIGGTPGAKAVFAGLTPAKYNGRVERVGSNPGIDAANGHCVDAFGAGAHMCDMFEIHASVGANKFKYDGTGNIPKSWIWGASWKSPGIGGTQQVANGVQPLEGISDTCASLTYPTGDQRWTGIAFEWTIVRTNNYGPKFHGGANALCSAQYNIACCK